MGGQLNLVTRDGAGKSDVIDHYALIAKIEKQVIFLHLLGPSSYHIQFWRDGGFETFFLCSGSNSCRKRNRTRSCDKLGDKQQVLGTIEKNNPGPGNTKKFTIAWHQLKNQPIWADLKVMWLFWPTRSTYISVESLRYSEIFYSTRSKSKAFHVEPSSQGHHHVSQFLGILW